MQAGQVRARDQRRRLGADTAEAVDRDAQHRSRARVLNDRGGARYRLREAGVAAVSDSTIVVANTLLPCSAIVSLVYVLLLQDVLAVNVLSLHHNIAHCYCIATCAALSTHFSCFSP